jgi:hypothetical protein
MSQVKRHSQVHLACFSGLQIRCEPGEFAIFDPPPGLSCAAWANDFVDAFGGYLENPSDTLACSYCQYKASFDLRMSVSKQNTTDLIKLNRSAKNIYRH